ncbi:MAG: TetR family transcriptional regulator [Candidatus Dormibacteria bacterium]
MATLSTKGQKTREQILDTALGLFQDRGYEATTMRMIATAAGVSLGNSYYYFPSKEHLVQGFYARMHVDLVAASSETLSTQRTLKARLRTAMRARIEVIGPYHAVAGTLFRSALTPGSALSPFSDESGPTRRQAIEFLRQVVEGSDTRIPADVSPTLPDLLWLYELGLVMFWVHDRSPEQERTYELVDDTVDAIVRLLALAHLPGLRVIRKRMLSWVTAVIEDSAKPEGLSGPPGGAATGAGRSAARGSRRIPAT